MGSMHDQWIKTMENYKGFCKLPCCCSNLKSIGEAVLFGQCRTFICAMCLVTTHHNLIIAPLYLTSFTYNKQLGFDESPSGDHRSISSFVDKKSIIRIYLDMRTKTRSFCFYLKTVENRHLTLEMYVSLFVGNRVWIEMYISLVVGNRVWIDVILSLWK